MIYEIKNNTIFVYDKSQFNPEHILECGQVFRFGKDKNNNYYVISKNNKATIVETKTAYEIHSTAPEYFVNYFDQMSKNADGKGYVHNCFTCLGQYLYLIDECFKDTDYNPMIKYFDYKENKFKFYILFKNQSNLQLLFTHDT